MSDRVSSVSASTPAVYGGSEDDTDSKVSLLFVLGGALILVLGLVLLFRELAKVIFCGKKSECFTRCQRKQTDEVVIASPEVDTHRVTSIYDPPPYYLALHYMTPEQAQQVQKHLFNINIEEEESPPSYQIALIMLRDQGHQNQ